MQSGKRRHLRLFFAGAIMCVLVWCVCAAGCRDIRVHVRGRVTDEVGRGLQGVEVTARVARDQTPFPEYFRLEQKAVFYTATTDSDGRFDMPVKGDTAAFYFRKRGFQVPPQPATIPTSYHLFMLQDILSKQHEVNFTMLRVPGD